MLLGHFVPAKHNRLLHTLHACTTGIPDGGSFVIRVITTQSVVELNPYYG